MLRSTIVNDYLVHTIFYEKDVCLKCKTSKEEEKAETTDYF